MNATDPEVAASDTDAETDVSSVAPAKSTERNRRKKDKKKANKAKAAEKEAVAEETGGASAPADAGVEVEYITVRDDVALNPALAEMAGVFSAFSTAEELFGTGASGAGEGEEGKQQAVEEQGGAEEEEEAKMSKKQKKKLKRLSIAELKQLVSKPEVVEQWDVTAADPRLLVHLKSYRNSIPVPKHWCQKRKFLMGKRGVEKPPFQVAPPKPPSPRHHPPRFLALSPSEMCTPSLASPAHSTPPYPQARPQPTFPDPFAASRVHPGHRHREDPCLCDGEGARSATAVFAAD